MMKPNILLLLGGLGLVWPIQTGAQPSAALVQFTGADFRGGAKDVYGTDVEGEQVNCAYAQATGKSATMQVAFKIAPVPASPLYLHLKGRDDDSPRRCQIAIELNGQTLFTGENGFSQDRFDVRKFGLPPGLLKAGENTLTVSCREKEGALGMPPWFQVAAAAIAPEAFQFHHDLHKNFYVTLPAERKPFPEPLPAGAQPGFKFRGTKGWAWTPEQYLAEIPHLARFKLTFLMNCYISMYDMEREPWNSGRANRWWEDFPSAKKAAYERVVRACQQHGIEFCFSMNPNLLSQRVVNDDNPESVNQLYQHYAWMQGLGVRWFNISLDDSHQGINPTTQAKVVNEILRRLRAKDTGAQMIFCPTFYWGDGTATNQMNWGHDQQPYLETLGRELHQDVYLFWTGEEVVGRITRAAAEKFRRISGHRLFLWDNYPVNDDAPTMHLAPVFDRAADLGEVVDGYMSNPHRKQNEINRLPLATCADYAYNPLAYDPARSIGQAILHLADTQPQREVLRDLVEAYPGMLVYGSGPGFNAVQEQFGKILALPHARPVALAYVEHLQALSARMAKEFPDRYAAARQTLDNDIQVLSQKLRAKYP